MKIRTSADVDMEQIFSCIPPLPADIDQWIDDNLMAHARYFFTYRIGKTKYGYCTYCKTQSPVPNTQIRHNEEGICPCCGKAVIFKDDGRGRKYLIKYGYFTIVQKLSNHGVILRSFYVRKNFQDYHNMKNELSEHLRIYYNCGVTACYQRIWASWHFPKAEDFYQAYSKLYTKWTPIRKIAVPDPYRGNAYRTTYVANAFYTMDDSYEGTVFQYACIKSIFDYLHAKKVNPAQISKYMELYIKYPVLTERLVKQGFISIALEKAIGDWDSRGIINWNKETVTSALKLTKFELKAVKGKNTKDLAIYQICKMFKASKESYEWIKKNVRYSDDVRVLKKLAEKTALNKIIKYIRWGKKKKQNIFLSDYADYISQCNQLSLDLTNPCILYPQDFQKAHSENSQLLTELKARKEAEKLKEEDKTFLKKYKALCKKYAFENETFLLRPASGKAELVIEGKTLNHCVYTNYADQYIAGKTLICVIRKKDQPDRPFYTLEYSPRSGAVTQCRGFRNCAMTADVKEFCNQWKAFLLSKTTEKKEKLPVGA